MFKSLSVLATILIVLAAKGYQCELHPKYQANIVKQLAIFKDGITRQMLQKAKAIPRTCSPQIINKKLQNDSCLYYTHRQYFQNISQHLPDTSFVFNYLDEPRILKNNCSEKEDWRTCACGKDFINPGHSLFVRPTTIAFVWEDPLLPVFGNTIYEQCFNDILMPSGFHLEPYKAQSTIPWQKKVFKAIWRGALTGSLFDSDKINIRQHHRTRLVHFCNDHKYCDARMHLYFNCRDIGCNYMKKVFGPTNCIPMTRQYINKIIIDIDGNSYSRRFPFLLWSSGSVIFKIKVFEDIASIIADQWVHYIPVKIDLTDFDQKIQWARNNDQQLQNIVKRGRELVKKTVNIQQYQCYAIKLLTAYQKLVDLGSKGID